MTNTFITRFDRWFLYLLPWLLSSLCSLASPVAYAAVGRTLGQSDVTRLGEEIYQIPLSVPVAVKGMAPTLALTYQHRQPETISGVGWVLEGLSAITRCPQTVAQDGVAQAIALTTADKFCLDGNRMRLTSGTPYGGLNTTYRLQTDTIARVTVMALGAAGDPQWFKVEQKNGLTYEYGNTADSRIESLTAGKTTTAHTWAVNKISDREGNAIVFSYQEDGAPTGGFRVTTIDYSSNSVQGTAAPYRILFVYESRPAGDKLTATTYLNGGVITNLLRLNHIDFTHVTTNTLVRRYQLAYEASLSNTKLSRVQSIQECAGSPLDCYAATNFGYTSATAGVGAELTSGTSPITPLAIDINGDGRTDLVYSSTSTSGTGTWMYQLANASGGFDAAVNTGIANTNYTYAIAIDYNSDGIDDVMVPYSGNTWWVLLGSTTGLQAPLDTGLLTGGMAAGNAMAIDWNGDGRDDFVSGTASPYGISVNTRNVGAAGFSAAAQVYSCSCTVGGLNTQTSRGRVRGVDFNGDGIRDVVFRGIVVSGGFPNITITAFSNAILGGGKGVLQFLPQTTVPAAASYGSIFGDFNGDGYSDVAYFDPSTNNLTYRLSTGTTFASAVSVGAINSADFAQAMTRDWNGDGLDDVLIPNSTTNTWFVYLATATGLSAGVDTTISTSALTYSVPVDLNGDGLDDIGYIKSTGQFAALPHSGTFPDLLNSVTDGYGNTIGLSYVSISQSGHTAGTGATFPKQNFQGSMVVVRQAAFSNGIGATHTKTYDYTNSQINTQSPWKVVYVEDGHGALTAIPNPSGILALRQAGNANQTQFLGFASIKVTDTLDNLVTVTNYDLRDPPFTGLVTGRTVYQSNGTTPIAVTSNVWASFDSSGSAQFLYPYVQQSTQNEYEVGGTFNSNLKRITTLAQSGPDAYGNLTSVTNTSLEPASGANGVQPGASYATQVNTAPSGFPIQNDATHWCLGKPNQVVVTASHNQFAGGAIVRTDNQSWDTTFCRLNSDTAEPLNTAYTLTRSLLYDNFGNIRSEQWSGKKDATVVDNRTTLTDYVTGAAEPGRFPMMITNAAGEAITLGWDFVKGLQTSQKDPNGVQIGRAYDALSRPISETRGDGTSTTLGYYDCTGVTGGCLNANNKTVIIATQLDASSFLINDTWVYRDKLDRVLSTTTRVLDGTRSRVDREYNSQGLLLRESAPCAQVACTLYWTTTTYDAIGRPTLISRPTSASNSTLQSTTLYYEGLSTRTVDPLLNPSTKIANALGLAARSADSAGYYQSFDYDGFGSLVRVTDSSSNTLSSASYVYGAAGFRVGSTDMDLGAWSYSPNAFGDVYGWQDANTHSFGATYDRMSRPLTRTELEGTTTWVWGASAAAFNIGHLNSVSSPGYSESYQYNAKGQTIQRAISSDAAYGYDLTYGVTGQVDTLSYPTSTSGCRVKMQYAYQNGALKSVTDTSDTPVCGPSNGVVWQANLSAAPTVNARGQLLQEILGNGIKTTRTFDAVTGLPSTAQSGVGGGAAVQNASYLFDAVGNMNQRQDNNAGLTESFFYDTVNRLDHSTLTTPLLGTTTNLQMHYDAMGNITSRSDVAGGATWTYDAGRKHAVLQAGSPGLSYTYDGNGNALTRNGSAIGWSSYNYPLSIAGPGKTLTFSYAPDRSHFQQVYASAGATTETTMYVGGLLEKVTLGSATDWRHYVRIGSETIAVIARSSGGTNAIRYILSDPLGSLTKITDSAGTPYVAESYCPYGARRDATTWSGAPSCADLGKMRLFSREGFTGQDMIGGNSMNLVHMNGRVEDAVTGRFLSADPYVQDPGNTQNYNRYSYVLNNPLSIVDPSGFCYDYVPYFSDSGGGQDPNGVPIGVNSGSFVFYDCIGYPTYPDPTPPGYPSNGGSSTPTPISLPILVFSLPQTPCLRGFVNTTPVKAPPEVTSPLVVLGLLLAAPLSGDTPRSQRPQTFYHYGYASQASLFAKGIRPGGYGTPDLVILSGTSAQQIYALPPQNAIDSPPDARFTITVPPGTPAQDLGSVGRTTFPGPLNPTGQDVSRTGGGNEVVFPNGTPPGSVSDPESLPGC